MNFKEIEKLIELFAQKEISKISLKDGEFELCLEKASLQPSLPQIPLQQVTTRPMDQITTPSIEVTQETPSATSGESGLFIESPMVGTFYRCPSPNAAPYVNVGDKIKKGQVIGIVEAMKIMNEIEAEFDCKIVEIVASDAQPVEFGSKLIKVEKL
ncbi:acetyl-CoA carboxylase biotin carboxyl carrier protein [Helicobacter pametensis]|uniref:acetyl-CoA carboxylase biotin carboxyl carrier protein n=1 Tax=Helicobacter pametensis TaxID=95149 RepID=UPI0004862B8B|nr:acetyl-CoA carboxylase biotin carboxyl carrier protein [Helicobacter pametensis]